MIYIGIDPGTQGAIVALEGDKVHCLRFSKSTEREIADWIYDVVGRFDHPHAVLEKVGPMPKQGISSTWKFAQAYGLIRGILAALDVPVEHVTPASWQKFMGCRNKGDKKITRQRAQELFPKERIVNETADAYVIAEFCRRTHHKETDHGSS